MDIQKIPQSVIRVTGVIVVAAIIVVAGYIGTKKYREIETELAVVKNDAIANANTVSDIKKQIAAVNSAITALSGDNSKVAASLQNILDRPAAKTTLVSGGDVTGAVSKAAPGVVSIVISKDVPNLEVTYEDPFGDSFFQIPVYHQKGTTVQKIGAGSGFLVSSDGYIITNKHVVADTAASYTVLVSDGSQKNATVVYRDPNRDLAIIKIPGSGYRYVSLGDSSAVKLGQTVIAIGNALGEYSNSVSTGIISGLNRTIQAASDNGGEETLSGVMQTDAAINPGNSGGPLIDTDGNAIGINVATIVGSSNISFAIPINEARSVIAQVVK